MPNPELSSSSALTRAVERSSPENVILPSTKRLTLVLSNVTNHPANTMTWAYPPKRKEIDTTMTSMPRILTTISVTTASSRPNVRAIASNTWKRNTTGSMSESKAVVERPKQLQEPHLRLQAWTI